MLKLCFVFTSLGRTGLCSPWLNTVYFQLLPSPSLPAVWIAVPQREMHGGILARTPKFLSPLSRWQLWVLAWKNNTEGLEPAVPTSAAESWGAVQGSALPCGWKVPVDLVTHMAAMSSSLTLFACFSLESTSVYETLPICLSPLLAPRSDSFLIISLRESVVVLKCGFLLA